MDSIFNLSTRVDSIVCTDIDTTQIFDSIQNTSNMIFQSEPNEWMKLLVPIFASLIVVCLGWGYDRWKKWHDEKEQREKYRQIVSTWIELINPKSKELVKTLREFSLDLKNADNILPERYAMPNIPFGTINAISFECMIDSFVFGTKKTKSQEYAKHVYNIISLFDFLIKINAEIPKKYEEYNRISNDLAKEWNLLYNKLNDKLIEPNKRSYDSIVHKWQTKLSQKPNSNKINLEYMNKLCNVTENMHDSEIFSYCNVMRQIIFQSDALHKGYSKVFSDIANNIENSLNTLYEIKEEIK